MSFVIRYNGPISGVYIRLNSDDSETGRTYVKDVTQATRFNSATQAAQYMMHMGSSSSNGGHRAVTKYEIVLVEVVPPKPIEETVNVKRVV